MNPASSGEGFVTSHPPWLDHDFAGVTAIRPGRPFWLAPRVAFVVLIVSVVLTGIVAYGLARQWVQDSIQRELSGVAQLKTEQIERWLDERRMDVQVVAATPALARGLRKWLDNGQDPGAATTLLAHLEAASAAARFSSFCLRSARDGAPLFAANCPNDSPALRDQAVAVARRNAPQVEDFHGHADDASRLDVGIFSPLALGTDESIQVVAQVSMDPAASLFPRLQRWPGASPSAEALLVRRDGDDVLYLNTLRYEDAPPLSKRLPVSDTKLLASQAVRGGSGLVRGYDYRGKPSVGYILPVANTPWFLVAKMDSAEADAWLDRLSVAVLAAVALLLLVAFWWWSERQRHMAIRHDYDVARAVLAERMDYLSRNTHDCILLVDLEGHILEANEQCQAICGCSPDEVRAMDGASLFRAAQADGDLAALWSRLADGGGQLLETECPRKDGRAAWLEISMRAFRASRGQCIQAIVRDITERKAAEARILSLSRHNAAMSAVNGAIARGANLQAVFRAVCQACVEDGRCRLAWVGLADDVARSIAPAAAWGEAADCLDGLVLSTRADSPDAAETTAIAYRENRAVVGGDVGRGRLLTPWQVRTLASRPRASMALPLIRGDTTVGVLTVHAEAAEAFDPALVALLNDLAHSLSFAFEYFARREERAAAELALSHTAQELAEAQRIAMTGSWEWDLQGNRVSCSTELRRLIGCGDGHPCLCRLQDLGQLFPPESMGALEQAVNATVAGGDFGELELELRTGSGGGRWLLVRAEAQRDAAGRVVCLHGTMQDITERKRVREQLEHDAAEIEDLYQNAPCGYHSIDGEGRFCRINDTELAWLGYSRSEVVGRLLITDILTPKSQQRFRDTFPGMKQAGYVRDVELDMISRNGEILPVLINATAILGADGRFLMTRSMVLNMKDRKGMEEVRQRQADRLAKLSRRLISVQEDERRRLSTELHDRTSPNLAALDINLRSLGRRLPPDPDSDAAMLLDDARALLADTADNIRDVCADLRPPILDYAGVVPALQSYAQQFAARTGIAVDVSVPERASRLDSEVESTVFRIAQESLTNCAKHARAGRISVVLNVQDRRLDLEIADDGVGFAADAVGEGESAPGLGLLSMQERAQFVGGSLLVSSAPGQGTRIVLSIPLARAPEKALVNQPEPVSPASWWLPGGGQLIDTQIPG